MSDALASAGVIVAGVLILRYELYIADLTITVVIGWLADSPLAGQEKPVATTTSPSSSSRTRVPYAKSLFHRLKLNPSTSESPTPGSTGKNGSGHDDLRHPRTY